MTGRRRRPRFLLPLALIAGGLMLGAFWPVRTRKGVDYEVSEHRLPLWRKGWAFVQRDRQTRRLADSLAATVSATNSESLALVFLRWTHDNIRPHPAAAQVVDDHPWSIIERGYGSNDQQADVFATLLAYAGVPAYWQLIGPDRPLYPISFALVHDEWRVFDVAHGIAFRDSDGRLASPEALAGSSEVVRRSSAGRVPDPEAYLRWFDGFRPHAPPSLLRAEMQMPGKRFQYELRRLLSGAD